MVRIIVKPIDDSMIYAGQIRQACVRLKAALRFHEAYSADKKDIPSLDASVLQVRKALELVAFASIAPNKEAFAKLRATQKGADFTRDYHAHKILTTLDLVFPEFYPLPLTEGVWKGNVYEFGRKTKGYLTRDRFESVYGRLGRHLHADNPWATDPNAHNLAKALPGIVEETYQLLELHARIIKSPQFFGTWVWRVDRDGGLPQMLKAAAGGDFVDTLSKPPRKGGKVS